MKDDGSGARRNLLTQLAAIDPRDIRRAENGASVWSVSAPRLLAPDGSTRRRTLVAARQKILTTILDSDLGTFVLHPDHPGDQGVADGWDRVAEQTYALRLTFDFSNPAAQHWLFTLGNWCLYSAPAPVTKDWPDPFRCAPAALVAWMQSVGVLALVAAWPDDTDWVIALAPEIPAQADPCGR